MEQPLRAQRSAPGRWRRALVLAAVAGLALTTAACGSDPESTEADLPELADSDGGEGGDGAEGGEEGDTADGDEELEPGEAALEFAQCMRDNGVADFPDPEINGDEIRQRGPALALDDPAIQAAHEICEPIMEQMRTGEATSPEEQAQMEQDMLAFAQCVRDQGFPAFPDPEFDNGRVTMGLSADSGIDLEDPAFQQAQEDCQPEGLAGPPGADGPGSGGSSAGEGGGDS